MRQREQKEQKTSNIENLDVSKPFFLDEQNLEAVQKTFKPNYIEFEKFILFLLNLLKCLSFNVL